MLNASDTAGQQAVEGGGFLTGRAAAQKTQQERCPSCSGKNELLLNLTLLCS